MKCPNCSQVSEVALVKCKSCGMTFDRAQVDRLEQLEFLTAWLDEHALTVGQAHARLSAEVRDQIHAIRQTLLPGALPVPVKPPAPTRSAEALAMEIAFGQAMLGQVADWLAAGVIGSHSAARLNEYLVAYTERVKVELAGRPVEIPLPSEVQVLTLALEALPTWAKDGYLYEHESLSNYLNRQLDTLLHPAPAVPTPTPPERIITPPLPKPISPPPPTAPPFDWSQMWSRAIDLAVSGALLRGLLYLGAFMIVVSAIVLVVVYWSLFPTALQLGVVFALPLSFYLAGFVLRTRLKIPVAGSVFIGIGALLVAVDLAGVYQLGGLASRVDLSTYWFVASIISTLIYALTTWRTPGEFFGHITLIGLSSTVLAFTQMLRLPLEWGLAAVTATSAAMIEFAARGRFGERWNDLMRAAKRLPILLVLIVEVVVLFATGNASFGQMTTCAFATLAYGLMAWHFPMPLFAFAAVASSLIAGFFGLRTANVAWEWYATTAAIVSPAYIFVARWLERHLPRDAKYRRGYVMANHLTGLSLVALAVLIGAIALRTNWWAGVIALALASVVIAGYAYVFRQPVVVLGASGLFVAPFSLAVGRWLYDAQTPQLGAWLMAAWAGLALAYFGIAVVMRKADKYAIWLNLGAHVLLPLALLALLLNYAATLRDWVAAPSMIALGGVILGYAVSAVIHDSGKHPALSLLVNWLPRPLAQSAFLLVVEALVPIWLPILWLALNLDLQWLATAFGALAIVYLALGELLTRRNQVYRGAFQFGLLWPWFLGIVLTLNGTLAAFSGKPVANYPALIVAQFVGASVLVIIARVYRTRLPTYLEPWLVLLPVTIFFIGHGRSIFGSELLKPHYAFVWILLGAIHLGAGAILDRAQTRYSHGLFVGGYGLTALALLWTAPYPLENLYVFGVVILIALASQMLAYLGKYPSFDDFIQMIWGQSSTMARRAAQMLFLIFAVYAFPVWLVQLLTYNNVPLAWRGFALAVTAPLYLAVGLALRRVRADYAWAFYTAAYALTGIGAMIAFENELIAIYVLTLNAVVYTASAHIFRQATWLYLTTVLVPIIALISLHYRNDLQSNWVTAIFMGLAYVYFGIGQSFDRLKSARPGIASFALPFYAPGYLLSAVALAVASGDKMLALSAYPAGVILYALSAGVFREAVFLYPAVWLVAVPYYLAMTLTPLPAQWYGIGWLPLIVGCIVIGKLMFHKRPIATEGSPSNKISAAFRHPALPFYLLAYALSVHMLALSQPTATTLTIASIAAALLYFVSAALFKRVLWLYPALLATHLALAAFLAIFPSDKPAYYIAVPFLGLTWVVALVGYAFSRRVAMEKHDWLAHLRRLSWAQPFFAFASLDAILWQIVALFGTDTAISVALGNTVLLGLFTFIWRDRILAYGTLGFGLLATVERLNQLPFAVPEKVAWLGGIGLGLYFVARIAEWISSKQSAFAVWVKPLSDTAIFLTALAVLFTLPTVTTYTTMSAAAFAFAGALYLAIAYRGHYQRLGYLGLAFLEFAWILVLIANDIRQPQLYAIPAGLYFTAVGYLERRLAHRQYATLIEISGLAVLLLTSFIQSLNGREGFPYFLLLLAEALLVIWWGAARRIKIPFLIGISASGLNVLAQVAVLVNVYDVNRFIVIFVVGLLLVVAAVFVERQRARLIAKAQEWREALEKWE